MAPAASSGVGPLAANASGLRKAAIRPISLFWKFGIEAVDRLGQHRVAEAIDRVRKLRHDRRIDRIVEIEEGVDLRLDGAGELLEHQMLVLHLGAELRRLEQPLAVPLQRVDLRLRRRERRRRGARNQPLAEEGQVVGRKHHVLRVLDQPVVLGVEDGVDGGQADVLVHPAVAGDVVRVEQLVVVGAGARTSRRRCRLSGAEDAAALNTGTALWAMSLRKAWPVRTALVRLIGAAGLPSTRSSSRGAGDAVWPLHHHLREAVRALDEVAIGIGREQRHVVEVRVREIDAEQIARLRLDHRPGGHAADLDVVSSAEFSVGAQVAIGDQPAGGDRIAGGVELIGAQEHLVRGMRRVGLVLIDERRGCVLVLVDVVGGAEDAVGAGQVGGPGQHHEVGRAAWDEQRIVRLQRDEDRAAAALGDEIEAVIEELAEERHPGVEAGGQTLVRGDVGNEEHLGVVGGAEDAIQAGAGDHLDAVLEHVVGGAEQAIEAWIIGGRVGRGIVGGLVDDQVGDGARLRVEHQADGLRVRRARLRACGTPDRSDAGRSCRPHRNPPGLAQGC